MIDVAWRARARSELVGGAFLFDLYFKLVRPIYPLVQSFYQLIIIIVIIIIIIMIIIIMIMYS